MLQGKVAMITGAGRGIGAATARLFAEQGARLMLCDIDPQPVEEVAHAICQSGGCAVALSGDVTDPAFPEMLVREALTQFGGIDIVVSGAGYPWDGAIGPMSDTQWEAMLAVHPTALFRLMRALDPIWREMALTEKATLGRAQARKFIVVSSISVRGNPGQLNYVAGKGAMESMTPSQAKEWGPWNIQVNCVRYGAIKTRLSEVHGQAEMIEREGMQIQLGMPAPMRQRAMRLSALQRFGTPEEAAGPMLFFASPLSDFVTGTVLEVSGGAW